MAYPINQHLCKDRIAANVTILGSVPRMIVMGQLWCSSPGLGFSQAIIWATWMSDAAWSGFRENLRIISSATPIATSELTGPDIIEHFRLMAGGVNFLLLTLFVVFSELKFLKKQKIAKSCDMIEFVSPGSDIPALDWPQYHRTVTHIFRRYGISGNVDGLKCSSMFLKDASSPLALQTSKAWTHTGRATEKEKKKEMNRTEISNQLNKWIIKSQKSN